MFPELTAEARFTSQDGAEPGNAMYRLPVPAAAVSVPPQRSIEDAHQEWDALDRLAAQQLDEPMLRFGGEDHAAELDPTVMTGVVGDDPIEAGELGLRTLDLAAAMLVDASTEKGRDYLGSQSCTPR